MHSDHETLVNANATRSEQGARPSMRRRAATKREQQRARLAARVVRPVVSEVSPRVQKKSLGPSRLAMVIGLSVAAHVAVAVFAFLAGLGGGQDEAPRESEVVTIREVLRNVEPAVIEPAAVPEPPLPIPEPPKLKRAATKPEPEAAPQVAADPVDEPAPIAEPPRRRIVGLSLESTTSGPGPAYAVGNTRMGKTDDVAAAPNEAGPRASGPAKTSEGVNQASSFVPDAGRLEKPRRVSKAALPYPSVLMARRVEGDVVLRIHISEQGSVDRVEVVRSSGHDEFDSAAKQAALQERFSPARRSGQAVEFVLEYTYRFRLKDA